MPRMKTWTAGAFLITLSGILWSCRDLPTDSIDSGGKVIENLVGCRVEVATGQTKCESLSRDGRPQGPGSLDLIPDAQWMVETEAGAYTPADSTYRFSVRITNDTETTLGTADGVQVTGLKVFLPVRVMGYTGRPAGDTSDPYGILAPPIQNNNNTVSARNPDGVASFTAEDQPYWHYPQILEPWQTSDWRQWQFTVDPDVSHFYFAVSIFTHAAGEAPVAASAPTAWLIPEDSVNALFTHQNLLIVHPRVSGPYPRNVVMLAFAHSATADERQAAIDGVGGTVVGGNGAHYYVRVEGGAEPVWWAIDRLEGLPQVEQAIPFLVGIDAAYRRPNNGTGWERRDWEMHPDSARGQNWRAEAIAAPGAWGCETGVSTVKAAVVDREAEHGALVGAILGSPGDTNSGTTGVSWGTALSITDASRGGTVTTGAGIKQNLTVDLRSAIQTQQAHVINISLSVGYRDSANNPRLPNPLDSADVRRALTFANEWRTVLTTIEAGTTHRPLYVIAAGNYQMNASFSGFPQLGLTGSLTPRVIVVAGHDSTRVGSNRAMWANSGSPLEPGSNTGAHIAAPGNHVHIRAGAVDDVFAGSSFAAPHVAGIAALLFSQVPSRTAETVRSYLMTGAARGGRTAGGHPIANAYQSLRRGAEDTGAPLCGNRVWAAGAQIHAQRGSGTEAIGPAETGGQIVDLLTQHGGRVILYNNTAQQGRALHLQANGSWTLGAVPADYNAKIGGATWSVHAYSHGADSLVLSVGQTSNVNDNLWWRSGDQLSVPIWKQMGPAYAMLGRITVNDLPQPEANICVERIPNGGGCTFTQYAGRWWMMRAAYPQAYQPVLLTVSPVQSVFIDSTAWAPCTSNTSRECRKALSDLQWSATRIYRVPLAGGTITLVDSVQNTVFWIGQTEAAGSDSLVMGRGRWTIQSWFDGNTRTQQTTTRELPSCAVEYRSLATLATVAQAFNNQNVCGWSALDGPANSGGGSFSPNRAPAPPGGGTALRGVTVQYADLFPSPGSGRD